MLRNFAIATLGLLGWVISYAFFSQWLLASNGDLLGGWSGAFTAHTFASGLLWDLVATTGIMLVVAVAERRRIGTPWAIAVVASLGLSLSVSLAIYILRIWMLRERGAPTAG